MSTKETTRVQIVYRSGHVQVVEVASMTVTQSGNGLKVNWNSMRPRPLLFGIDDVESIWELENT